VSLMTGLLAYDAASIEFESSSESAVLVPHETLKMKLVGNRSPGDAATHLSAGESRSYEFFFTTKLCNLIILRITQ
jgi:hypothetical protein